MALLFMSGERRKHHAGTKHARDHTVVSLVFPALFCVKGKKQCRRQEKTQNKHNYRAK